MWCGETGYGQEGGEEVRCKWNEDVELDTWGDTEIQDEQLPVVQSMNSQSGEYISSDSKAVT